MGFNSCYAILQSSDKLDLDMLGYCTIIFSSLPPKGKTGHFES